MPSAVEWSEIVRNYGIVVGGFAGIGVAVWRGWSLSRQAKAAAEQTDLARRAHVTEIFNRAVGQLGDDKFEVRLGAIYALREICLDRRYGDLAPPIAATLQAYVRERTPGSDEEAVTMDVEAIMDLLKQYGSRAADEG